MSSPRDQRHLLLAGLGFTALFGWLWAYAPMHGGYPWYSDLYEEYLPTFLARFTWWSSFEFGGAPSFASPSEANWYPPRILFRDVLGWLPLYIASANVIGAVGTYLAVRGVTHSRNAALLAGLAYGLSEALLERASHLATMHTVAWFPWVVWATDRMRRAPHWRAIPALALTLGMFFLAGNPQSFLYGVYFCFVYGLVGALVERSGWRFYAATLAAVVLGALLGAIEALPMLELSTQTNRAAMNVEQFMRGLSGFQLFAFVIPTVQHDGRGEPTYVGLVTLVLACLALVGVRRNWRVSCWLLLTILAILVSASDVTPIARWAYNVPFYDRFRIASRHLFIAAFGFAMLAGLAVASIERRRIRGWSALPVAFIVPILVAVSALSFAWWPGLAAFDERESVSWLPSVDLFVALQFGLGVVSAALVVAYIRRPVSRMRFGALALLLVADLAYATQELTPYGLDYGALPAEAAQRPSVHAAALAASLSASQQRLLSPAGTHVDDVVPAAFARLWRIPIAGGYNSMMLANHYRVALMNNNGSVEPQVFADQDSALDILSTKYLAVHHDELDPGETMRVRGLSWAEESLNLSVGPEECRRTDGTAVTLGLPNAPAVRAVAILAHLECAENVTQDETVAGVRLQSAEGVAQSWPIRAGVDVADGGLADAAWQQRARHRLADMGETIDGHTSYLMRFEMAAPATGLQVTVTTTAGAGRMVIDRVTAVDDAGSSYPQGLRSLLLANSSRWKEAMRFSTSRTTDRAGDETAGNEERYVVYENLRARPRAWLVEDTVPVSQSDAERAVHFSILPDGRRFDPARKALVLDDTFPQRAFTPGGQSLTILPLEDGLARMTVRSSAPAFLVFSENKYPGWEATVDDTPVEIHRVNVAHMGVEVPAGLHQIVFRFRPRSFLMGASITGVALVAVLVLAFKARRR